MTPGVTQLALLLALVMAGPAAAQLGQDPEATLPGSQVPGSVPGAPWYGPEAPAPGLPPEVPAGPPAAKPPVPTGQPPTRPAWLPGRVEVDTLLRVRAYPWGPVIGGLTRGDELKVLGVAGEFYAIAYQGGVAFVHRRFVALPGHPAGDFPLSYPPGCEEGGYVPLPPGYTVVGGMLVPPGGAPPAMARGVPVQVSGAGTAIPAGPSGPANRAEPRPGDDRPPAGDRPGAVEAAANRVAGQAQGDGTPAGAVAWGLDQLSGGRQRGLNSNNGKRSSNVTAWDHYCLAFVATAYGRKIPDLAASTAYNAYRNCKRSGRPFSKDKDPPAGAVYFTGPTSGNSAGHTFLATGERDRNGEPLVLTNTGYGGLAGIQKIPLSRMLSMVGGEFFGWTRMP